MDRRKFLKGAAYFTVVSASGTLAACGGSGSSADGQRTSMLAESTAAFPNNVYSFPQGIASGDPKESSVVFWTRCVSRNPANDPVELRLQVATNPSFQELVVSVPLVATATYDYTVRVKVRDLLPDTRYYYRFVAGQDASHIGKTKTAPAAGADVAQMRFAWLTCQDWTVNHWGAMELLIEEEVDFLVHLGDYIYETVGA